MCHEKEEIVIFSPQIVLNKKKLWLILIQTVSKQHYLKKCYFFWIRKNNFLLKPSFLNVNDVYIKHCLKLRRFKIQHNLDCPYRPILQLYSKPSY